MCCNIFPLHSLWVVTESFSLTHSYSEHIEPMINFELQWMSRVSGVDEMTNVQRSLNVKFFWNASIENDGFVPRTLIQRSAFYDSICTGILAMNMYITVVELNIYDWGLVYIRLEDVGFLNRLLLSINTSVYCYVLWIVLAYIVYCKPHPLKYKRITLYTITDRIVDWV